MSSKRPYTANNIKPTAIRELPVRNETTVWAEASICILLTSFGFRFLIGSVGLECARSIMVIRLSRAALGVRHWARLKSSKQILPPSINRNGVTDMFNAVPVTVCMPVYNGALYIRDAIESILNQTVIPQEIIVSDSGSSDGTVNIIRDHAERTRVKLIILPAKTPGMVANWNATIRAASGKYIKFLFQDDLLHANCLEEMMKVAESDERIGLVFSQRKLLIEPSAEGDAFTTWLLRYQDLSAALGELKTSQPGPTVLRSQHLLHEPLNKIGEPTAVLIRTSVPS